MIYINSLITAGIAVPKDEKSKQCTQYAPTRRLLKIWMANQKYAKRKAIAQKIAEKTHTSKRVALQDTLPYLKEGFKNNEFAANLTQDLELNDDEVGWLRR